MAEFDGKMCIKTLQRMITYNGHFHDIETEYNQHIHPVVLQFMVRLELHLYTCKDFERRVKQLQVKAKKCDIKTQAKYDDLYIRWQQTTHTFYQ